MRPQNLLFTALLALFPTLAPAFQPLFDTWISYEVGGNSIVVADLDGNGNPDVAVGSFNGISVLRNNGDGSFAQKTDYVAGGMSVISADLDGDGDLDLVGVNRRFPPTASFVSVLKNNGDGTFALGLTYEVGGVPYSVTAADLDGDRNQDLITANLDADSISVLKNNGDGTFAAKVDYETGRAPWAASSADIDGDGDLDLVTANNGAFDSGTVSILKNNGNGTFAPKMEYSAGKASRSVAISDFDNDGDADLAVGNRFGGTFSIFMNNGDGTFANKIDYPAGGYPNSVIASDVDNDGDYDLVATGTGCWVLLNNGVGNFSYKSLDGPASNAIDVSDLDGNGSPDIAVVGGNLSIFFNKGDGHFPSKTDYAAGGNPSLAFVVDMNRDGYQDLLVGGGGSPYGLWVFILKNEGDGSLFMGNKVFVGHWLSSIFSSDLDGNQTPDLVVAKARKEICDFYDCWYTGEDAVLILANDGDTNFIQKAKIFTGNSPSSVFSADFDGDGDLDLAVANFGSFNVSILKNEGNWNFASKADYTTLPAAPYSVFASDLDADMDQDLIVGCANAISVFKNNGDGSFASKVDYGVGRYISVVAADLDADGDMDLAAANPYRKVAVFLNNGDGTFAAVANYETRNFPISVVAADLDGDGDKDLALTDWEEVVTVLKNTGNGTFDSRVDYGTGPHPDAVVASDLDNDGDMELITANYRGTTVSVLTNLSNPTCQNNPGDLDHDCILTIGDIVPQLNCVFLNLGDCRLTLTDVNCSGAATPVDVVLLLLAVFASQPLPCP